MKNSDRKELLRLLKLYIKDYESEEARQLISSIQDNFTPSKAGRKPKYGEETKQIIFNLHKSGYSIRKISTITGCSAGYIQKTIKSQ